MSEENKEEIVKNPIDCLFDEDNNDPIIAKIPSIDFSKNMNLYENVLTGKLGQ